MNVTAECALLEVFFYNCVAWGFSCNGVIKSCMITVILHVVCMDLTDRKLHYKLYIL